MFYYCLISRLYWATLHLILKKIFIILLMDHWISRQNPLIRLRTYHVWFLHHYQNPCSQTLQLDHTCVLHPRSSSHRSDPCSQCLHHTASGGEYTTHPHDTGTHLCDSHREDGLLWRGKRGIKQRLYGNISKQLHNP